MKCGNENGSLKTVKSSQEGTIMRNWGIIIFFVSVLQLFYTMFIEDSIPAVLVGPLLKWRPVADSGLSIVW